MTQQIRPALFSQRAASLNAILSIQPFFITLQTPRSTAPWHIVPPIETPLIFDLFALNALTITMILSDLRRQKTWPTIILSPQNAVGLHHLIAGSGVTGVVIQDHPNPNVLSRWVVACASGLHILPSNPSTHPPGQLWIGIPPPPPPYIDARFLDIVAALPQAPSLGHVARQTYLSKRTLHRLLQRTAPTLGVTLAPRRRHRPAQWSRLLASALEASR